MRTPKTKRTALTQAVISSLTGETLPIKKKRKAFGHLLTQVLPALAVVGMFAPNAAMADTREITFNDNTTSGTGFVIDGYLYNSDGKTLIDESFGQTTDEDNVYGLRDRDGGDVQNANVTFDNSTADIVYGGRSADTGSASKNVVTVQNGSTVYRVYGGYAGGTGAASGNSVTIKDSKVLTTTIGETVYDGTVYGGYSSTGTVSGNTVFISGSSIGSYVSGGYSVDGIVSGNSVTIDDSKSTTVSNVTDNVYGGRSTHTSTTNKREVSGNIVTITGNTIDNGDGTTSTTTILGTVYGGTIYGGENISGTDTNVDIYENHVVISGANLSYEGDESSSDGFVYGGYSSSDTVSEAAVYKNTAQLTDTVTYGSVYGGRNDGSGTVSQNTVTINNSVIHAKINTKDTTLGGFVIGGDSEHGSVSGNEVIITGSTVDSSVMGGRSLGSTEADVVSGNQVTVTNSKLNSSVYGGYGEGEETVSSNVVELEGTTVAGSVLGGRSAKGEVSSNTVTLVDSTATTVYGGESTESGTVEGNEVSLSGGEITGIVYGGYSTDAGTADISGNKVTLQDTSARGIYGGRSSTGKVSGNSVSITGGATGGTSDGATIYGGYSLNGGEVSSNTVTISGDTNVNSSVYGGRSAGESGEGQVSSNTVTIEKATVTGSVTGGRSEGSGDVSENTVTLSSTTITSITLTTKEISAFYGGRGVSGDVSNNTITLKGTTIKAGESEQLSSVYGGYSETGEASSNTVTINGGELVVSDIYGGYSGGDAASTNTVTIGSADITGNIYGGVGSGSGDVSNNSIEISDGAEVTGDVIAGSSGGSGAVTSNTVTLNDGKINGDTFAAGYSTGSGEVSDNVFNINGGTLSGGFTYGGYSEGGGSVTGNTINLNGGTVSGTLYAGYGSDTSKVKNNTINLDGNVESRLSDINVENAILYGSNIGTATGSNGNTLNIQNFSGKIGNIGVFDNVNLDLSGIDLANAVYGSGSVIILTDSAGEGTNFTNSTVNIYNSSSSYSLAVGFTSESELSDEYTIFANANSDMTKTNATINEKIMVVQDPDKYPNLIAYSEYDLSSDDDGTISYILNPETAGTYVPNEGRTVTALAGAGAKLSMYYAQLDDLRKRLGEVRYGAQDGIWARFIYQQDSFAGTSSYDAKQRWYGLNVGLDRLVSQDEDRMWLLGANFKYGHAKQKVTQSLGGKGNLNSYGVNLYATYANQYGCYADFVVTFDDYHQKLGVKTGDTSSSSGDYSSWGWGASIELGKMFSTKQNDENWGPWHNHWWVEPQAQLSYYWLKGKDFVMSSGKDVSQNNGQSLVGRLGLVVGKHWSYGGADKVDKRYVQVYLKGGVKHEFLGKQDLRYAGKLYNDRLRGTTGYYGAGVDWNLTKQVKAYAQVERESGGKYKKDIEASIGLKWQF